MFHRLLVLLFTTFFIGSSALISQSNLIEEKVDSVLQLMTLQEKVGQMNLYNGFWDVTGPVPKQGTEKLKYDHLKSGQVGAMLNIKNREKAKKLQELVVENSRLGIPLLFGFDLIHGQKTIFPIPLAESASWDLPAMEKSARISAIEASALGINWTFAPMVDISRDARWGRVMEGAGEDPYLGSAIAAARIRGFQGSDLSASNTIAATAKHFAAYGFQGTGREYFAIEIGMPSLYNIVLPPFKASVDAGVKSVMNSFSTLNNIPSTGDAFLQRDILKSTWGFQGFVVSDWFSTKELETHGFANDLADCARIAANAGSDMDMESYAYVNHLADLVESGDVEMSIIDDAVKRILRVKFELGLFDDPYRYCRASDTKIEELTEEHMAIALDMALNSIVLLKNEDQILPISKEQKDILLIGELAADKNSPLGNWRLGADDNSAVSVLEGIHAYTNQSKYAKGVKLVSGNPSFAFEVEINQTDTSGFFEAIQKAKEAELVIMVLGENGFQSGEGRSRTNLGLPGLQQELLEAVHAVNPNIILVLMNGRPLALPWAVEHIPAILETWHLGSQSGHAIAKTLFGDNNPSGKLTMSFPRSVGQVPIFYNSYSTGRPGSGGNDKVVFWSHYSDESNSPLFPFGYGLSYSNFEYTALEINSMDGHVRVSVQLKNNSEVDGTEVVQLYLRDKAASIVRPISELKGFSKVFIPAGASKKIEFLLGENELGYYDQNGQFRVDPGDFDVLVGPNSQEGLTGSFTLEF